MSRSGLPSLRVMMKRQQRIIGLYSALLRLAIPVEALPAFDAFVAALNTFVAALGPPEVGS